MVGETPRRVLLLTDTLEGGGAERQLALLAKSLPSEWTCRVWSLGGGPFERVLRDAAVDVDVHERKWRLDVTPSLAVWKLVREWRPHVVHAWGWMAGLAGGAAARAMGVPFIDGTIRMGMLPQRRTLPGRVAMTFATRVIANSQAGLTAWGIDEARGRVVRNGFDARRLAGLAGTSAGASDSFVVGMVGRTVKEKDYSTFISAARQIVRHDPRNWKFLIVGSGADRERLLVEAAEEAARGVVEFVEPHLEVLDVVSACQVGVLLSDPRLHAEGCSNAIIEYMACGLPVVCSKGGGNAEVVLDGVTGFLVEPGDARALACRLLWLRDHPAESAALGAEGRVRQRAWFSVESMVKSIIGVYDEVLGV